MTHRGKRPSAQNCLCTKMIFRAKVSLRVKVSLCIIDPFQRKSYGYKQFVLHMSNSDVVSQNIFIHKNITLNIISIDQNLIIIAYLIFFNVKQKYR